MSNFWPQMIELQVGCGATRTTYTTFDYNLTIDAYYCAQKDTFYSQKDKKKRKLPTVLSGATITEEGELVLQCGEKSNQTYTIFNYNLTLNASYCGDQQGEYVISRQSSSASGKDAKFAWICVILFAVYLVV